MVDMSTVVIAGDAIGDAAALAALLAPTGALVERAVGGRVVPTAGADVVVLLPGCAPLGAEGLAALPGGAAPVDASAPGDAWARAVGPEVLAAGRPLYVADLDSDVASDTVSSSSALVVPVENTL